MSVTETTRLGLFRWSSGSDSFTRSQLDSSHAQIEALVAGFLQSTTRPAAGVEYAGFIFFNTTTEDLSYCDGAQWFSLNSFGTPTSQLLDDSVDEGTGTEVARATHKHGFPGFAAPVEVGTSTQTGIANTLSHSDHRHKLAALSVPSTALQAEAVTNAKIAPGAVSQTKMGANSIGSNQIITGAVGSTEIAANAVNAGHIQPNAVDTSEIADGAVGDDQVSTISAAKITGTVSTSPDIAATQVVSGELALARIPNLPATKITSLTFDTARIPNLSAAKITSGTFNVAQIPSLAASKITTGDLADARGPERIKTTFAGTERTSRVHVNNAGPSGGATYDIWIEY